MRKAMSRILLSGILAAAVLGATACSSKKEEATQLTEILIGIYLDSPSQSCLFQL